MDLNRIMNHLLKKTQLIWINIRIKIDHNNIENNKKSK